MNFLNKIPKKYFAFIPDKLYLFLRYFKFNKKFPNFKNGTAFDIKIHRYLLTYRNDLMPIMADKYAVRSYIENLGYGYLLNELYGVYKQFDDIDFDVLPTQFVLKANHGCGYNLIVKDKNALSIKEAKKMFDNWMNTNFFYYAREWVYKDIDRKIICEKYLENKDIGELIDYKVHCFHGKVKIITICSERNSKTGLKVDSYNEHFEQLELEKRFKRSGKLHKKPACFDQMINISQDLSKVLPYMRVDFYIVNEKLLLGELSFFPNAGITPCKPASYNEVIGSWLHLDEIT